MRVTTAKKIAQHLGQFLFLRCLSKTAVASMPPHLVAIVTVAADPSQPYFKCFGSTGRPLLSPAPGWHDFPETRRLRAALHTVLRGAPRAARAVSVDALLCSTDGSVYWRHVIGPLCEPPRPQADTWLPFAEDSGSSKGRTCDEPADAVRVCASFAAPARLQPVSLEMLVLAPGHSVQQLLSCQARSLLASVFSSGPPTLGGPGFITAPRNACPAEQVTPACIVRLGADPRPVSPDALSSWSAPQREYLRSALRAMPLLALAACIDGDNGGDRWHAGLDALRAAVSPLLAPADLPCVTALVSRLADAAASPDGTSRGGVDARSLTARIHHGEALEAAGKYAEAAVFYESAINDNAQAGEGLLDAPFQIMDFLGIARKRSGDLAGAQHAYNTGLAWLKADPPKPLVPPVSEYRETLRLNLLQHLANALVADRHGGLDVGPRKWPVFRQIWGPQRFDLFLETETAAAARAGLRGSPANPAFARRHVNGDYFELVGLGTGARLSIEFFFKPASRLSASLECARAVYLPPGAAAPEPGTDDRSEMDFNARAASEAQARNEARRPALPKRACAVCGEPAASSCSSCVLVSYCGRACQALDWKSHKKVCKKTDG